MFGGIFVFVHRNARVGIVVAVVAAAIGAAGAIGRITAPVA